MGFGFHVVFPENTEIRARSTLETANFDEIQRDLMKFVSTCCEMNDLVSS
jgi:hypothetical protein